MLNKLDKAFLKVFLTGGSAITPGLEEFFKEKLNIETSVFDPFENIEGIDNISRQIKVNLQPL